MKHRILLSLVAFIALLPLKALAQFGIVNDVDTKYATSLPKTGEQAPDFKMKTLEGKTFKLSSLKKKVIILNFWASWCPDCRGDMPEVENVSMNGLKTRQRS